MERGSCDCSAGWPPPRLASPESLRALQVRLSVGHRGVPGFFPSSGLAVHHSDAADIPDRLSGCGLPIGGLRDRHRAQRSCECQTLRASLLPVGTQGPWLFACSEDTLGSVWLACPTRVWECGDDQGGLSFPLQPAEGVSGIRGHIWSVSSHKRARSLHAGSKGRQGLFMFSDNSSLWVYGLSHFGAQSFPHLFLNVTEKLK